MQQDAKYFIETTHACVHAHTNTHTLQTHIHTHHSWTSPGRVEQCPCAYLHPHIVTTAFEGLFSHFLIRVRDNIFNSFNCSNLKLRFLFNVVE